MKLDEQGSQLKCGVDRSRTLDCFCASTLVQSGSCVVRLRGNPPKDFHQPELRVEGVDDEVEFRPVRDVLSFSLFVGALREVQSTVAVAAVQGNRMRQTVQNCDVQSE